MPEASPAKELIPFPDAACGEGKVTAAKQKEGEVIPCPTAICVKVFKTMDQLQKHIDTGKCKYEATNPPKLTNVKDMWVKRYTSGANINVEDKKQQDQHGTEQEKIPSILPMGWAVPKIEQTRLNERLEYLYYSYYFQSLNDNKDILVVRYQHFKMKGPVQIFHLSALLSSCIFQI